MLPLTPAQYNAGTAKPVLESTRDALTQGRGDLIAARNDAAQIVTILQGLASAVVHLHHGVLTERARRASRVAVGRLTTEAAPARGRQHLDHTGCAGLGRR